MVSRLTEAPHPLLVHARLPPFVALPKPALLPVFARLAGTWIIRASIAGMGITRIFGCARVHVVRRSMASIHAT